MPHPAKDYFHGEVAAAHAAHVARTRHWPLITDVTCAPAFEAAGVTIESLL